MKGVNGVPGVDIYRPLHLGQRPGSSGFDDDMGLAPLGFPARRGWYL